jgi:hypothetical protein
MSLPSSHFEPPHIPPPARFKGPWLILLACGLLLVPCLCCGGFLALAGRGISMAVTERGNVQKVVNDYLQKMDDKDVAGAYAMFSRTAKKSIPQSKIEEMVEGQNYGVFSDFQSATVTNIQIHTTPSRTVAKVQGTVAYDGGVRGTFSGVVGREGDAWMIDGMHVTVPPSKLTAPKSE